MAFRKNIKEGWTKNDTIIGDGFTINTYRYAEATIDPNCDALNGWYTTFTKFKFELIVGNDKDVIIVNRKADADKLYTIFDKITETNFGAEGYTTASENAITAFTAIKTFLT